MKIRVKKNDNTGNAYARRIPVGRDYLKNMSEFWGRNIQNIDAELVGSDVKYQIKNNDLSLEYAFNLEAMRSIIQDSSEPEISVGWQTDRMYLSLIWFAYMSSRTNSDYDLKGSFTYKELIDLWGLKQGGRTYKTIKDLFISLCSATFTCVDASKKTTYIFHPVSKASVREGINHNDTQFSFSLDPDTIGLSAEFIRYNKLSLASQKKGYVSIPISRLSEKKKSDNYENFRSSLLLYQGGELYAKTILENWLKLSKDKLRRRKYCYNTIADCLQQSKDEGLIRHYRADMPLTKGWIKRWKVSIFK